MRETGGMYVAEVTQPGTWVSLADRELAHRVEVLLLTTVLRGLDEAAVALHLFRSNRVVPTVTREGLLQRMEERAVGRPPVDRLWADRSLSPEETMAAIAQANVHAPIAWKRQRWASREVPPQSFPSLSFTSARTFV